MEFTRKEGELIYNASYILFINLLKCEESFKVYEDYTLWYFKEQLDWKQ